MTHNEGGVGKGQTNSDNLYNAPVTEGQRETNFLKDGKDGLRKRPRGVNIASILRGRPDLRSKREEAHKAYYQNLKENKDTTAEGLRTQFVKEFGPLPKNADRRVERRYRILMTAWMRLRNMELAGASNEGLARMETRTARFWESYESSLHRLKRLEVDAQLSKIHKIISDRMRHPKKSAMIRTYIDNILNAPNYPLPTGLEWIFVGIARGDLKGVRKFDRARGAR